jgi:hypothetical protein
MWGGGYTKEKEKKPQGSQKPTGYQFVILLKTSKMKGFIPLIKVYSFASLP